MNVKVAMVYRIVGLMGKTVENSRALEIAAHFTLGQLERIHNAVLKGKELTIDRMGRLIA